MAVSAKLGDLYVELKSKGLAAAIKDIDAFMKAQELAKAAATKLADVQEAAGRRIALSFGAAYASVMGFVRAGLAGTTMGEVLGLRFQQLSREIAQLFLPIIEAVLRGLERLVNWFKNLTGTQQNALGTTLALAGAFGTMVLLLPQLVASLKALQVVIASIMALDPVTLVLMLVSALVAVGLATEKGRGALAGFGAILAPIGDMFAAVGQLLMPLVDLFADLLKVLVPIIVIALMPLVVTLGLVAAALNVCFFWLKPLGAAFEVIGEILAPIMELFSELMGLIGDLAKLPGALLKGLWAEIKESWKDFFDWAGAIIKGIVDFIMQIVSAVRSLRTWLGLRGSADTSQRNQLQQAGGGFEAVEETFRRIQGSAIRSDIPQRQLDALERIETNTRRGGSAGTTSPTRTESPRWVSDIPATSI